MPEHRISELLKRLKTLELQSDAINVERKLILARIERANTRADTRPVTGRAKDQRSARGPPGQGTQRSTRARGGARFVSGDRVYVCNQVKPFRGRRPTDSDRYATVRYTQSTGGDGGDQVYITTDSGNKTYRLSKNLCRVDLQYCAYEKHRH